MTFHDLLAINFPATVINKGLSPTVCFLAVKFSKVDKKPSSLASYNQILVKPLDFIQKISIKKAINCINVVIHREEIFYVSKEFTERKFAPSFNPFTIEALYQPSN